jgi:serine/threonine protein kinase
MLTCQKIFRYKNISELYNNISCSNELSSFLNGMLTYDPKKRLTIEELSNHPFLTKDISQFNKIIINNNRVERTNINENSRFSTNVSKSMFSSGTMFTGWSNVDEGSRKLFYQFDNKSRQMQKLNNPQNININNINPNMQIQNKNLDHRNIPENQNVINNIPNNKNSNLSKSMFQFQSKNSLDESTTIINNSSYMEFSTYQNDLKFQNIKNNFNQSQNPSQNSPSTSFTTNNNQKLSYNNNYQTNYYSQIDNYTTNNFNNYKHSISGPIKQNPQKPVLKNYQYSYSGKINYKA